MNRKKKNRARGLIIGCCVVVLLVVVLLVVRSRASAYEEEQNQTETLFDETADKISRISYTANGADTVTIERKKITVTASESVESGASSTASGTERAMEVPDSGTASAVSGSESTEESLSASSSAESGTTTEMAWVDPSDPDRDLDETTCGTLASSLTGVSITQTLTDVDNLSEYGLDNPSYVVEITFTDGSTKKITIGDTNSVSGTVYCYLDDDTATVYAVSTSITTNLNQTIDDLTAAAADTDSAS